LPPEEDTVPAIGAGPQPVGPVARAASAVQLPATISGKYRPVRLIAKGGMGAVYEVIHANTGEHLALKLMLARSLLSPELVERFRREARISSSVKSAHVVRVVDADVAPELDDAPFLVMELLDGRDFERICLERSPSAAEVVDWMRQLAPALDKAHQLGIIHRDLKPENIFLADREGQPPIVKILDFGIAKVATEGGGSSTATGQILGTPRYMAPEQATGTKEISPATDRFALALIAFRLLCGRHYFAGDNWVGLLRDVARGPQARPSACGSGRGPAFDAWFAHACAFDPDRRFPSCAAQVEALAAALEGISTAPAGRRRRRAWAAVGAAGAVLATAWGFGHRGAATAVSSAPPARSVVQVSQPASPSLLPPLPRPSPVIATSATSAPGATANVNRPRRRRLPASAHATKGDPPKTESAPDRIWDEP
jgi:serine/threonine protein kinase